MTMTCGVMELLVGIGLFFLLIAYTAFMLQASRQIKNQEDVEEAYRDVHVGLVTQEGAILGLIPEKRETRKGVREILEDRIISRISHKKPVQPRPKKTKTKKEEKKPQE